MNNDLHDAPFDLIFDQATVVDGTGAPSYVADVAISGDRIGMIGDLRDRAAFRRVDSRGLILSPGFIDVHTHQDNALLVGPEMAPSVSQGITGGRAAVRCAPARSA
ncbi:hypothetical protein [Sphingobium xenophagum]|uniref:N-acyl-D-amino-acid deacylase n=1 Tax=Sphingobium xenophagum TaxID=121428 RepID=A0A401J8Y8_SPHXE|nr:hypothetical protein [Sphingobium xenophagum]GBH33142.1 N-acyl-D-amino-acid deacylase [Sphingobium xenophagum]